MTNTRYFLSRSHEEALNGKLMYKYLSEIETFKRDPLLCEMNPIQKILLKHLSYWQHLLVNITSIIIFGLLLTYFAKESGQMDDDRLLQKVVSPASWCILCFYAGLVTYMVGITLTRFLLR